MKLTKSLVSVEWLNKHLGQENLIVLNATIPKVTALKKVDISADKEQIKGAVFFDIKNTFSDANALFPNTVLSPFEFQNRAQTLGINNESCIVVYDDLGIYSAPRVWWMFQLMGFNNIAVLNGGFPKWKAMNLPIEKMQKRQLKTGNFIVNYCSEKLKTTTDILSSINKNRNLVIDARSKGRFLGTEPEPRTEVKSGHIPYSLNLPFSKVLEMGEFKPKKEIVRIFKDLNPNNLPCVFSCGSGITASILALAAEISEQKGYSVYDGSWTEWGSTKGLPIEI